MLKRQPVEPRPRKPAPHEKLSKMRAAFISQVEKGTLGNIVKVCEEEEHLLHDEPPSIAKAPKAIQICVLTANADADGSKPLWGSSNSSQIANKSNLLKHLKENLKSG